MKAFYRSKTFWFNMLALVVMVAGNFGYGEFTPHAWVNDLGTVIILSANLVLRFITKEPITLGRAKSEE